MVLILRDNATLSAPRRHRHRVRRCQKVRQEVPADTDLSLSTSEVVDTSRRLDSTS
jgi:hypothetical protein